MKKRWLCLILIIAAGAGCSINIDVMGRPNMEEVVLLKSPAKEKILVVDVEGLITSMGQEGLFSREGDVLSQVYSRLQKASEDRLVRGVILRLDTPGGDATSSDILYREIRKFRNKTGIPVVALMMSVAASGGFYAACACDAVVAHPSTITGSIGVISIFPNLSGLMAKVGVEVRVMKSGTLKDAGSPFRDMSQEDQQVFQGIIDEFYQGFLDVVYEKRKDQISMAELRRVADGRVYTAPQALDLKLIDEVGYFDEALARVLSLASLKAAGVVAYTYYPKRHTNLYAAGLSGSSVLPSSKIEDLLPTLKAGFYYLWLPEMKNP